MNKERHEHLRAKQREALRQAERLFQCPVDGLLFVYHATGSLIRKIEAQRISKPRTNLLSTHFIFSCFPPRWAR